MSLKNNLDSADLKVQDVTKIDHEHANRKKTKEILIWSGSNFGLCCVSLRSRISASDHGKFVFLHFFQLIA